MSILRPMRQSAAVNGRAVLAEQPKEFEAEARRGPGHFLVLALALSGLAACSSRESESGSFGAAQTYQPIGRDIRWGASSSERFGTSSRNFALGESGPAKVGLSYTTPPGWSELPAAQFRDVNFRVAGDASSECYLSTLGGEGGGLAANVNRWRKQMSLDALSAEAVAALPQVDWLGKRAVAVDFTGTWTGMSGDHKAEGWRLVGYLLVEPAQSRFLKMTGPAEVLDLEIENFRALAASFRAGGAPANEGPSDGAAQGNGELPAGHPPISDAPGGDAAAGASSAAAVQPGNRSASGYEWTPPEGWKRGPEKSMREITYLVGDGAEAECYVTVLGGSGGGMLANINRWCGQMGHTPLTESDLAKLERITMLGTQATLVELERDGSSSGSAEYLLGAVCLLPEHSVFVKMTGPRALLVQERAAFQAFCKSARNGI